jgi:hypothetical protein
MNMKYLASAGALAAALLSPGLASANFVLDTGTPATGTTENTFNSNDWYAEEFSVAAGDPIVSLSAYLNQGAGSTGATFTFDIYSNSADGVNFIGSSAANRNGALLVASVNATFNGSGWTSAPITWTPSTSGDYWLAIQQTSTGGANQLDAPQEATTGTGTVPALAYAIATTSAHVYGTSTAAPIGLEVNDANTPVPLPAAAWLLVSGLGGLGTLARRRRNAA